MRRATARCLPSNPDCRYALPRCASTPATPSTPTALSAVLQRPLESAEELVAGSAVRCAVPARSQWKYPPVLEREQKLLADVLSESRKLLLIPLFGFDTDTTTYSGTSK